MESSVPPGLRNLAIDLMIVLSNENAIYPSYSIDFQTARSCFTSQKKKKKKISTRDLNTFSRNVKFKNIRIQATDAEEGR